MHLAVLPCDRSVLLQHHGSVVVESRGTALKEGKDEDDTELLG